jgi:signal transduction histidine kinase/ligand-binding sensor domain-containing protein/AraC-like DNA-binding protein
MATWFKIFLTLLFAPILLFSQNHIMKFEHLTVDDGLSGSVIECIMRDSKGFMWFGTRNGLNRYDGYKFTIYRHDVNNPQSISHNWIKGGIIEDSKGDLWIGTWGGGLNKFDRNKEIFIQYKHDDKDPNSICNNFIERIYEDESDNLWICTVGGLSKVVDYENLGSNDGIQFVNYKHNPEDPYSLSDDYIFSAYEDNEGVLWIGTASGGINLLDRGSERFINENNLPAGRFHFIKHPLLSGEINWFHEYFADGDSLITISTNNVIYKLDKKNNKITNFSKALSQSLNISVRDIGNYIEDRNGQAWIFPGIQSGLYVTNKTKDIAFGLYSDPHNPFSINSNYVQSWYEDKEGIIWIGTLGGGVNKYMKDKDIFRVITVAINESECSIASIHEDISEHGVILWIGTRRHGLLRYDMETKEIRRFKLEYPIKAICQTKSDPDNIWIGTIRGGLLKFNKKNKTFSNQYLYESKEDLKRFNFTVFILSVTSDEKGILWIGSGGGLIRFDPDTKKFKHYFSDLNNEYSLSDNEINSLLFFYHKNERVLWVGTRHGGLNRFDPEKEKFYHFKNNPDDSLSIASDYISSIYEDDSGNLWIGTTSGLQKFDRLKNKFFRYTDKDRLLNIDIMGILGSKDGILWLHTKSGICRFNPQNRNLRFFDKNDGLPEKDFDRYAYHKGKSGDFYFGRNNKILVFDPENIQKNSKIPPVVITDFQILNKSVKPGDDSPLSKSISNTDEIILPFNQSVFSFEFAALDYTTPDKNKYAYKMEGIDPDWVYTDASRRYVTYTHLNPGEHVFRVKGSNNDGVWNEEGTALKIIITPPWWRTNWAYSFYVLLILSMVYGIWRFQTNRLKMKQQMEMEHFEAEKLREVDHLKSSFFANISHEFRTPLTLIQGPIKQMLSGEFKGDLIKQYRMIIRYSNRLLNLINQILDLSKLEAGRMTLKVSRTNVTQFLKGIVQSFASLADRKKITLKFNADDGSLIGYVDRDKLEKIVTNLLSNAFKFTPGGGKVIVNLSLRGDSGSEATETTKQSLSFDADEIATSRQVGTRNDSIRTGSIKIKIFNSGTGIPPEELENIFNRFYQADNSYTKELAPLDRDNPDNQKSFDKHYPTGKEGTGIGLALTKELVDAHHGEIRVESELNKGTTFRVLLPVEKEHFKQKEIVEAKPPEGYKDSEVSDSEVIEATEYGEKDSLISKPSGGSKAAPLLLIVEDNPDVTTYISSFVEKDYRIITAENGEAGWKNALDKFPDLIISDVMMPVMDGFELCKKLKSYENTSHIPVILLTAKADMKSKIEGLEFGADDYVTKPFDAKELHARVKNLIEQRIILYEKFSRMIEIKPGEITTSSMDEQFLKRLSSVFEEHVDEGNFSTEDFAREAGMSRSNLHRKLQALTNQPTHEFIRTLRLKRAAQLLNQSAGTVTEIAYAVGFNSPSHFSRIFRQQFGQTPSEFARNNRTIETS